MMIYSGLVSVSFRKLSVEDIVKLCEKAGIAAVEWGGDVHVPHGKHMLASGVAAICRDSGIECPSYGSYYKAAEKGNSNPEFSAVLDSAQALSASTIRVWAGTKGSAEATPDYYQKVADDINRIAAESREHGVSISLEYHGNTLTDTPASVKKLCNLLDSDIKLYWQPLISLPHDEQTKGLKELGTRLSNIHVYRWENSHGGILRKPLAEGESDWKDFLAQANGMKNKKRRYALLEFFKDDSPEQFIEDAKTLNKLLSTL